MTGLSFSLPGLEQVSDPRQLRACLLRLSEELRYALSHISGENFSEETRRRLSQMETDARTAGELAQQNGDQARQEFRRVYEELVQSEQESGILAQVTEDFTAKSETAELEETFRTELEQTSRKIELRFSEAADLTQQVAGELEDYQNRVDTYIQFTADGITLGERDSPFTAVLGREKLSFLQNGAEIAYLSNNRLFITSAEVLDRLTVGNTGSGFFDWVPRGSGNLGMKWRGVS